MKIENEFWRTLFRVDGIQEAFERLVPLLQKQLGVKGIIIRILDKDAHRIETIVQAGLTKEDGKPASRTSLDESGFQTFLCWAKRKDYLLPGNDAHKDMLNLVCPSGLKTDCVVVPLVNEDVHGCILFLVDLELPESTINHLIVLGEPCLAAVRNFERLRELSRLREALDADKRALLGRLQREDISEAIVGSEAGLRDVMQKVAQVSATDAPVLLLGETGSGKEVIARAIHANSARSTGPMIKVNCGAIPLGLVDSELFGHERGSFTGAHQQRYGWFERADGGTLFLDEIGELPLQAQVRLLRVLQEGVLERVGGQKEVHVNVRIVAATNRDLEEMILENKFREDLWYRIGVFPIEIPPLRHRTEDIPSLASHFAWRAGKRLGGLPISPSSEDVQRLIEYSWPGNVRELAAVIERAAILGDGKKLEIGQALGVRPLKIHVPEKEPIDSKSESLEDAMKSHIESALKQSKGRVEGSRGAASLLGINPHTLRSRMRRLNIDWKKFK